MPKCTDAAAEFGRLGRRVIEANRLQAEGQLSAGLSRLCAVAENYPDLKANTSFMQLQALISALEEQIAFRGRRSQFLEFLGFGFRWSKDRTGKSASEAADGTEEARQVAVSFLPSGVGETGRCGSMN